MAAPKMLQQTNSLMSKWRTVVSGVDEGGVLGPIIFSIIINDIVGSSILLTYLQVTPS